MQEIHRLKGSLDWNPGISLRNYIIFDCIMAKKKPKKTKKETSSIALIKQNCPRGPTKAQCCEDLSRSHNAQTTWASTKPEVGQFMVMGEIYYTLSSMSLLEWHMPSSACQPWICKVTQARFSGLVSLLWQSTLPHKVSFQPPEHRRPPLPAPLRGLFTYWTYYKPLQGKQRRTKQTK